jgi:hypothetical protein
MRKATIFPGASGCPKLYRYPYISTPVAGVVRLDLEYELQDIVRYSVSGFSAAYTLHTEVGGNGPLWYYRLFVCHGVVMATRTCVCSER